MDNYIVSARKYRPMTFDSVIGQHALTTTLKNAIAGGKLAHAYLFCGPRGVGKTTCARIFAKTINCQAPKAGGEACDECESCQAFNDNRSLNIFELDAASNNGVDDIRALIEQTSVPPQLGKYKVFIIDEVHMLSAAAFNAFLKTLEEPPAHVIFVLATTEKQKIPATILSRCQIYDFNRMEIADIVDHLKHVAEKEGITYEEDGLGIIAQKADGGMRDALSIFDQVASFSNGNITYQKVIEDLNILDYEYYFRITDHLLKGEIPAAMLTLNDILGRGFGGNHFMSGLARHFRSLLVAHDAQTLSLLEVGQGVRQRYQEQAAHCKPQFLYRALRLCNDCDMNYRGSSNKRLLVELTLIELSQAATDDSPGSGLGPTKKLKPIFQSVATAPAAPKREAAKTTETPTTKPATTAASATAAAPTAPSPQPAAKATQHRPMRQSVSLAGLARHQQPAPQQTTQTDAAEKQVSYGNKPVDPERLGFHWLRFSSSLPREDVAMAERMKNLHPTLQDGNVIEVAVDNPSVLHDFNAAKQRLTDFFRRSCENDGITFRFRLAGPEEQKRVLTRQEFLREKMKQNKALAMLVNDLQLTID